MDSNDKRASLTRKISEYFGALCALTDEAARSDAVRGYLQAAAMLRGFSLNNQLLILIQHPVAEPMAGFHTWRKLGRQVRKGEHGAAIFVPMRRKAPAEDEQDTAQRRTFFGIGYVFGQSQTEGEPLPQPPVWTSTEGWGDFERVLERVAESFGLSVECVHASGRARGVLDGQHIRLAHDAGSKTLLHELAHHVTLALLDTQNTAAREHVAEAVTYITARVYGRAVQSAPNYLALWHANADARISRCCRRSCRWPTLSPAWIRNRHASSPGRTRPAPRHSVGRFPPRRLLSPC